MTLNLQHDLIKFLINKTSIEDASFIKFIDEQCPGLKGDVKSYSDCSYFNYYTIGISIMTKADHKTIDTIFLYSDTDKQYKEYKGTLPFPLSIKSNNVQVVKHFNREPEQKGGGGAAFKSIPIWIEFHEKLNPSTTMGITFNFMKSDWRDLENPLHFITLFIK